ncbi:AAA family ATPase [Tardiphaga sp. 803_E3_N1_3]|uniref:AAA family ATPase n=1 Tax=unclassified Tardiphaga TaxID=2631404 RepID=UPI003F2062D7
MNSIKSIRSRLAVFEVSGLFGLFNHHVTMRTKERITIIHAPNGYGKTAVLKMISGFFGGSMLPFRQYEFASVTMRFTTGEVVKIDQTSDEKIDTNLPGSRRYSITMTNLEGEEHSWSAWDAIADTDQDGPLQRFRARDAAGIAFYRDPRTGERIHADEWIEKYEKLYARGTRAVFPPWLAEIRSSLECRLIETQRLMVRQADREASRNEDKRDFIPAVRTFSQDVSTAMRNALTQSATINQSLDQTFPNRLLAKGRDATKPLAEAQLRARLADLQKKRARLRAAGLLTQSDENTVLSPAKFDPTTRRILTLYVADTQQKLDVFNELLGKIEAFMSIINKRFQFKSLSLDKERGFVLTDFRGNKLDPDDLSSGEQHELVLIYELLFKTKADSLLLIDEPEISLHIAWQKHVLPDLRQIIALAPMDVILATHSPQLAGGNLNLIETLQAPK